MEKYMIRELHDDEQFVLNVPIGRMRMDTDMLSGGVGEVVFAISDSSAKVGTRVCDAATDVLRIICQTPQKAEMIARAFIELACKMREEDDE